MERIDSCEYLTVIVTKDKTSVRKYKTHFLIKQDRQAWLHSNLWDNEIILQTTRQKLKIYKTLTKSILTYEFNCGKLQKI